MRSPSIPVNVTFTISPGVVISAISPIKAALIIEGFAPLSVIRIINRGSIIGAGGIGGFYTAESVRPVEATAGGSAIKTTNSVILDNSNGNIYGGGGGGGAGEGIRVDRRTFDDSFENVIVRTLYFLGAPGQNGNVPATFANNPTSAGGFFYGRVYEDSNDGFFERLGSDRALIEAYLIGAYGAISSHYSPLSANSGAGGAGGATALPGTSGNLAFGLLTRATSLLRVDLRLPNSDGVAGGSPGGAAGPAITRGAHSLQITATGDIRGSIV